MTALMRCRKKRQNTSFVKYMYCTLHYKLGILYFKPKSLLSCFLFRTNSALCEVAYSTSWLISYLMVFFSCCSRFYEILCDFVHVCMHEHVHTECVNIANLHISHVRMYTRLLHQHLQLFLSGKAVLQIFCVCECE